MVTAPSQILVGNLESCPEVPGRFLAFGERDDPMRLIVLMAQHVAALWPQDGEIQRKAESCLDPRAPWKTRHRALGDALMLAADRWTGQGPFIALVDIDALVPQGEEGWKGDRALSMRKDLFTILGAAIERGGWLVLRTFPSRQGSLELDELDAEIVSAPDPAGDALVDEVKPFAPDVRPIAAWLLRRSGFQPRDLSGIVEDAADFDAHVVDLAYQYLSPRARDAGKLLAALRPSQHYNGSLGPFAFGQGRPSATTVPRSAVEELRASGFLQPGLDPSTLRMPRPVREMLGAYASMGMTGEVRKVHARLGALPIKARPAAEQIEIHHHAVQAENVVLARNTALFYGTELRDLATQLGLEANATRDRSRFRMAADLFEDVVKRFDETDAYAWEYLAYNLARTRDPSQNARILHAYERAHSLWRTNPLYHGRLLGFRGQLGRPVASDVMRWLDHYVSAYRDENDAVSYFAESALTGLRRGGQQAQLDEILSRKRALLERFAPRALASVEDDE